MATGKTALLNGLAHQQKLLAKSDNLAVFNQEQLLISMIDIMQPLVKYYAKRVRTDWWDNATNKVTLGGGSVSTPGVQVQNRVLQVSDAAQKIAGSVPGQTGGFIGIVKRAVSKRARMQHTTQKAIQDMGQPLPDDLILLFVFAIQNTKNNALKTLLTQKDSPAKPGTLYLNLKNAFSVQGDVNSNVETALRAFLDAMRNAERTVDDLTDDRKSRKKSLIKKWGLFTLLSAFVTAGPFLHLWPGYFKGFPIIDTDLLNFGLFFLVTAAFYGFHKLMSWWEQRAIDKAPEHAMHALTKLDTLLKEISENQNAALDERDERNTSLRDDASEVARAAARVQTDAEKAVAARTEAQQKLDAEDAAVTPSAPTAPLALPLSTETSRPDAAAHAKKEWTGEPGSDLSEAEKLFAQLAPQPSEVEVGKEGKTDLEILMEDFYGTGKGTASSTIPAPAQAAAAPPPPSVALIPSPYHSDRSQRPILVPRTIARRSPARQSSAAAVVVPPPPAAVPVPPPPAVPVASQAAPRRSSTGGIGAALCSSGSPAAPTVPREPASRRHSTVDDADLDRLTAAAEKEKKEQEIAQINAQFPGSYSSEGATGLSRLISEDALRREACLILTATAKKNKNNQGLKFFCIKLKKSPGLMADEAKKCLYIYGKYNLHNASIDQLVAGDLRHLIRTNHEVRIQLYESDFEVSEEDFSKWALSVQVWAKGFTKSMFAGVDTHGGLPLPRSVAAARSRGAGAGSGAAGSSEFGGGAAASTSPVTPSTPSTSSNMPSGPISRF